MLYALIASLLANAWLSWKLWCTNGLAIEYMVLFALSLSEELFGADIAKIAGVGRGIVYVHLDCLEGDGLIVSREEALLPGETRLPRRLYRRVR